MHADSIAAFWDPIIKAGNETAMIHAGLELQVWAKISAGHRTADELAGHEGWDPTGTRALLDALFAIGLLEKDEAGYQLAPIAEQTLLPGSPAFEGGGMLLEWVGLGHSQLAETIRTGKRPVISDLTSESARGGHRSAGRVARAGCRLRTRRDLDGVGAAESRRPCHIVGSAA
jgi:hypothetical protein